MPIGKKSGNLPCEPRILPMDRTLSAATLLGQSEPRSDGNEVVLHIPQSSTNSDGLVSYLGHSLEESYPTEDMHRAPLIKRLL